MKIAHLTQISCILGIAVLSAGSCGFAAQAETLNSAAALTAEAPIDSLDSASLSLSATPALRLENEGTIAQSSQPEIPRSGSPAPPQPGANPGGTPPAPDAPATPPPPSSNPPGVTPPPPPQTAPEPPRGNSVVSPGRATRSGPSYVGVGGNIGLGDGDTALGEGSFAIFSKIGLTRNISVRPSVLVNDNPTILIPVTFDFIPGITPLTEQAGRSIGLRISPFLGAGVAISTGDDGAVDFLATGGVDVPIARRITATAAVNASLFDNPAVGLMLGVGYNF